MSSPEGLEALNFVVTLFNDGFTNRDEAVTAAAADAGVALEGKVGGLWPVITPPRSASSPASSSSSSASGISSRASRWQA
ncbi:MAG: hypothetical protein WBA63_06935 [Thermomicrobiales bacterium]